MRLLASVLAVAVASLLAACGGAGAGGADAGAAHGGRADAAVATDAPGGPPSAPPSRIVDRIGDAGPEDAGPEDAGLADADRGGTADAGGPPAVERCNGRDDDGDGATDEGLQDPDGDGVFDCPDYTKDPVLFVHGYMGGLDITWMVIEDKLVRDGWPPEFLLSPTFRDVTGCNPEHGDEIQAWVRELRDRTGREKIDVVAHSMGGPDVRWYIRFRCGYRYIRDYVTLAGAHHGTYTGCLDLAETCGGEALCRALEPADAWRDNPALVEVNACDETPWDAIRYTSIWSAGDEIIRPQDSSVLDGARNIRLESRPGHAGIVLEDEPYEWLKVGLDGGGWNANVPTGEGPCVELCAPGL